MQILNLWANESEYRENILRRTEKYYMFGKQISHCNPFNERKQGTTENKWATEKKERKQRKKHWENVTLEEEYMDEGGVNPTKQKLFKIKWDKHI